MSLNSPAGRTSQQKPSQPWTNISTLNFKRYDKYGQQLRPGDICARSSRDKVELVIYKGDAHGKTAKYGRFISPQGVVSLKFTSVAFAFDPMGNRRAKSEQLSSLLKIFYEGE